MFDGIIWTKRDAIIKDSKGNVVFEMKDVEAPKTWSDTAIAIVASKFFQVVKGKRETSVKDMILRVVDAIATAGKANGYFTNGAECEDFRCRLAQLVVEQKMSFNSPVYFNIGACDNGTASACFILNVDDSMKSILDLVKTQGMIYKSGAGTGVNFSKLREKNAELSTGGKSSGPLSFMRGSDTFAGSIRSGGSYRRAASMNILNIDHPDIEEFIECKKHEEEKARVLIAAGYSQEEALKTVQHQNANHSVGITEAFMQAVESNAKWDLVSPSSKKIVKTVDARELFSKICDCAHACGDPGLFFLDNVNTKNPCKDTMQIECSNPCQPGWATVLTPNGVQTFDDISVGSIIWSGLYWTKVVRKECTGYRRVYKYDTGVGCFVGTDTHQVISNGKKVQVKDATSIQVAFMPPEYDRKACGNMDAGLSAGILEVIDCGEQCVYNITVDDVDHTYWTDGLLVSNCGEFVWCNDSACNLASLNLLKFFHDGKMCLVEFDAAIHTTITAMDILVDLSGYPTEVIANNSHDYRPLGLGFSNLGALLMLQGMAYDSDEGREFARLVTRRMMTSAIEMSEFIAKKLGAFPRYKQNTTAVVQYYNNNFGYSIVPAVGIRNAQLSLCAPTGTISFMMDCATFGIEPEMGLVKYKTLVNGGVVKTVNPIVRETLNWLGYSELDTNRICAHIEENDTIEGCLDLEREHESIFDCAYAGGKGTRTISADGHLKMVEVVQKEISGAISKTISLPKSANVNDVWYVYRQAWKRGLKDVIVYRDGSKEMQPLVMSKTDTTAKKEVGNGEKEQATVSTRRRLLDDRKAMIHKFSIGGLEGYLTVGLFDDGTPGELFCTISKAGSLIRGLTDALCVMVSLALQYGVPLENLADKFTGWKFDPSGYTMNKEIPVAQSIVDYMFRWLGQQFCGVAKTTVDVKHTGLAVDSKNDHSGPLCSSCGNATSRQGTCWVCTTCGTTTGCS